MGRSGSSLFRSNLVALLLIDKAILGEFRHLNGEPSNSPVESPIKTTSLAEEENAQGLFTCGGSGANHPPRQTKEVGRVQ